MQCEICGSGNATKKAVIEGSELVVCNRCCASGRPLSEAERHEFPRKEKQGKESHLKEQGSHTQELSELKDNYGEIIRRAREAKGMTIEEFANSLFENASWIRKIEQGKLKPDAKLISKLEKNMSIKLMGD